MKVEIVKFNGKMFDWESLVNYMDDEICEKVHDELAPCTNEEFLERYLELDPEFENCFSQMLKYRELFVIDKGWIDKNDGSFVSDEIETEYFTKYEEALEVIHNIELIDNEFIAVNVLDENGEYAGAEETIYAPGAKKLLSKFWPEEYKFNE